ncbi:Uncharacterised protein [uncultured Bacteroides sp.]|nr:Uncharacterised protein [uncultured Bacteroides sp.]
MDSVVVRKMPYFAIQIIVHTDSEDKTFFI